MLVKVLLVWIYALKNVQSGDLCGGCDGGICVVDGIIGTCQCFKDYTGDLCEFKKCSTQSSNYCGPGVCEDELCNCEGTGFTSERCNIDIDECVSDPCQNGAVCTNTVGSFDCVCQSGFVGELCEFAGESVTWSFSEGDQGTTEILVGESIEWIWSDTSPHTVTSVSTHKSQKTFEGLGTPVAQNGFRFVHTFTEPGLYPYEDLFNPTVMFGRIRVYPKVDISTNEPCCLKKANSRIRPSACIWLRRGLSLRSKKSCDSYKQCFWCDPSDSSTCPTQEYERCPGVPTVVRT